jgi:hypothetical protein
MNPTKLARISALTLVLFLFLSALPVFAAARCSCNFCQRFPERNCNNDGTTITCLEFLAVALCPAAATATSADVPSSKEAFLAALSREATPEPAGGLNLTR